MTARLKGLMMAAITIKIFLIVITVLIALVIGLRLRHLAVRRLEKTVLDTWIVQVLGVLLVLPSLIIAAIVSPIIWDFNLVFPFWTYIQTRNIDIVNLSWKIVQGFLLIVLGIGTARTAQKLALRGLGGGRIDINLRRLVERAVYIIILTFVAFWVLSIWNVSIAVPATVISILTLAVAFAIQDILKDLIAGFYILVERPFRIKDQISMATYTGQVVDVQLRATKLRLLSGEEVTIPNALVFGGIVINNTYYGERRATLTAILPQEEFVKNETSDKIIGAIKELEQVIAKSEPTVMVSHYTSEKITLTIRFWLTDKRNAGVSEVMHILHTVLPNAELAVLEAAGDGC